jgi:transcriptional regulator with XRE-family HTH domain
MTLAQVAEDMNIDATAVSRLERNATPYDQTHLRHLTLLYKCTIQDLLSVDPGWPPPATDQLVKRAKHLEHPDDIKAALTVVETLIAKRWHT